MATDEKPWRNVAVKVEEAHEGDPFQAAVQGGSILRPLPEDGIIATTDLGEKIFVPWSKIREWAVVDVPELDGDGEDLQPKVVLEEDGDEIVVFEIVSPGFLRCPVSQRTTSAIPQAVRWFGKICAGHKHIVPEGGSQ